MIAVGNLSGRVSTEVDARLSFDTEGTIAKVKELAALYEEIGVNWGERVLFKVGCLQNAGEGGGGCTVRVVWAVCSPYPTSREYCDFSALESLFHILTRSRSLNPRSLVPDCVDVGGYQGGGSARG